MIPPPDVVVIGCSAGGIEALNRLLPALPRGLSVPVVVVIHLAPDTRHLLAALFGGVCAVPVKEAEDKERMRPGHVYLAPADYHLMIERDGTFALSQDERVNFSRPSIDVLFESTALAFRERALGIVLTGANQDGAAGLRDILELGGRGLVQDPLEAPYPTMPRAAADAAGPRVETLGLGDIARRLSGLGERSVAP